MGFWASTPSSSLFALVAVVTADRPPASSAAARLLFFALAMGDFGPRSPFHLLKSLPVFGQLRFPTATWWSSCSSPPLRGARDHAARGYAAAPGPRAWARFRRLAEAAARALPRELA